MRCSSTCLVTILLLLLGSGAAPVLATTYLPISDGDLADQAAVIVEGTVGERRPVSVAGEPWTGYAVQVERRLKGQAADEIELRLPGGERADGLSMLVWGSPELAVGDRVLLFLLRHADGSYRPLHLMLGTFFEVESAGRRLAVRDLANAVDLRAAGEPESASGEPARDVQRFSRWLADRAAGIHRGPDYLVAPPVAAVQQIREKFTYNNGIRTRWFEFDRGESVGWRALASGMSGFPGGGFAELQAALAAWNGDPASNVRYRYDGTTPSTAWTGNPVLFDDPNNVVSGGVACSAPGVYSGGIVAIASVSYQASGAEPFPLQAARIIVNDGAICWITSSALLVEVLGHELGHTLGLGHSCGDSDSGPCNRSVLSEALMRSSPHGDGRGARLNEDDRAGLFDLYPQTVPDLPAAPSGLTAAAVASTSVQLAWADNSASETQFQIEMKSTGSFRRVLSTGAGVTSASLAGLAPRTTYTFRVRARNDAGFSSYSNEATATTPAALRPPAAPSGLAAERVSASAIRLTWQDRADNETQLLVERSSPDAGFVQIAALPAGSTRFDAAGLAPETPYTFRVRARNAQGASAFSNLASATTAGPAGPCAAGPQTLCLLGGRFKVFVHWRNPRGGAHGVAGSVALPGSNQTGLFWFFGADNVELIVKMLDGRERNGFYWTFYGGLTSLAYWITVVDTLEGTAKTYHNEAGSFCGAGDVRSLPGAAGEGRAGTLAAIPLPDAPAPVRSAACAPGTLCLLGGRFQVEVTWRRDAGSGAGTPVPLSDETGLFWFFDPANVELVSKVLDGRSNNGKFWFFYGALSNVEYDVRVTDTATGAVRTYHNEAGRLCGRADTGAFDG